MQSPFGFSHKAFSNACLRGGLILLILLFAACAGTPKPSLKERLSTMSDADLVAYYQGVDFRLKAVGDGVRRETADAGAGQGGILPQQTYFLGGEGNRLLRERDAAEKELVLRKIPRSKWVSGPD